MINRKVTNSSFNGIMNIAFCEYTDEVGSGQLAVTDLVANNFYYMSNDSRLNTWQGDLDITGFFNLGVFGTAKINSLVTNYLAIPTVSSGDSARNNPDNRFINPFEPANRTFFEFLNSEVFNSFDAVIQLTQYFNWSLVANLFGANSYGYSRQKDTLTYASISDNPIFTCELIIPTADIEISFEYTVLSTFCSCINEKNKIQVIILWMSTTAAIIIIEALRKNCKNADKWTFVITNDYQTPFDYTNLSSSNLVYAMQLRSNGPWDFQQYVENCEADASPAAKPIISSSIAKYYKLAYNCIINYNDTDLPQCPESLLNRTQLCICTGNELNTDPYASRYFFSSDMISAYAYGLDMLQNNCTFLNEMERRFGRKEVDFCTIDKFAPPELSFAMRYINFTGYTGPIFFPNNILKRAVKSFYIYMNNTLKGVLTPSGPSINASSINWINDKKPISEIVPQNPGLEYPSVATFFFLGICELIVCIIVIIFYFLNINHPIIKRHAPFVGLVMLIGVTFMAIAQILISLNDTDAFCWLTLYFYRFGLCFLILGLVVKNYRIYRIFSNKQAIAIHMPESKLLMYIGFATFVYIGCITVFVCVLGYETVVFTSAYDYFYQYVQCVIPNDTWDDIFRYFLQIPIIIVLIVNIWLAWLTHKVKSEYSESRQLAAFSIIMGISFAIFIPLSLTLGGTVNSAVLRAVINDEYLTIVIVSALALLFIPKILKINSLKRKERRMSRGELSN